MSDRADRIMELVRDDCFSSAEDEIDAMEADLMQHATENARLVSYVEALKEALSVIAGEPHRDDTYVGMSPVQVARAALHGVGTAE